MVDLMNLLSDVLIGGFQMLMLNDLGKNMFSYRIKTYWTRILIYGVTVLVILGVNHIFGCSSRKLYEEKGRKICENLIGYECRTI